MCACARWRLGYQAERRIYGASCHGVGVVTIEMNASCFAELTTVPLLKPVFTCKNLAIRSRIYCRPHFYSFPSEAINRLQRNSAQSKLNYVASFPLTSFKLNFLENKDFSLQKFYSAFFLFFFFFSPLLCFLLT